MMFPVLYLLKHWTDLTHANHHPNPGIPYQGCSMGGGMGYPQVLSGTLFIVVLIGLDPFWLVNQPQKNWRWILRSHTHLIFRNLRCSAKSDYLAGENTWWYRSPLLGKDYRLKPSSQLIYPNIQYWLYVSWWCSGMGWAGMLMFMYMLRWCYVDDVQGCGGVGC